MRRRRDSEEGEEASGAAADLGAVEGSGAGWAAVASEAGLPAAGSGAGCLPAGSGAPASEAVAPWLWPVSAAERSQGAPDGPAAVGAVAAWRSDPVWVFGRAGAAVGQVDVGQMQMHVGSEDVG